MPVLGKIFDVHLSYNPGQFMKYYFIILSFLMPGTGYSQTTTTVKWQVNRSVDAGDTIYYYAKRKLMWNDFRGRPETKGIALAMTSSGFGYLLTMSSRNGKTNIKITVYCFYDKNGSWVKPGGQSDYALIHEQHHFDIAYISACNFIKKIRAASVTVSNYDEVVQKINTESNQEMEKMQNDYDGQTKNGQLKNIQAIWNKKIDEQVALVAIN